MNRGSTPTLTFSTPLKASQVAAVSVVFTKETGALLSQKTMGEVHVTDFAVSFSMSQTETMGFPDGGHVETQIRLKDTKGNAYVSNVITVDTGRLLKDELL